MLLSRRSLAPLSLAVLAAATGAAAGPRKPKPPPGRDPGGVAVVLIGEGLDYTLPEVAQHLARDGEGEPIAWDFADADRLPYAPLASPATALARIVLAESPAVRLMPVRIAAGATTALVPALQFVANTPARVVGLLPPLLSALIPQDRLAEVAARLPRCLIVVGARHLSAASVLRPNLLAVAAMVETAQPAPGARADVAISLDARNPALIAAAARAGAPPGDIAVARVLALAPRLVASRPDLDGAGLKAEILSHARPLPTATSDTATHGWLPDIARIHGRE